MSAIDVPDGTFAMRQGVPPWSGLSIKIKSSYIRWSAGIHCLGCALVGFCSDGRRSVHLGRGLLSGRDLLPATSAGRIWGPPWSQQIWSGQVGKGRRPLRRWSTCSWRSRRCNRWMVAPTVVHAYDRRGLQEKIAICPHFLPRKRWGWG